MICLLSLLSTQAGNVSPKSHEASVFHFTFHLKTFKLEMLGVELGPALQALLYH